MVGVVMASVSPLAAVTQFRRRAALNTYTTWSRDGEKIKDQKPQLSLLLQVLTDEKRFIDVPTRGEQYYPFPRRMQAGRARLIHN
jgi:hypothetical protein